MTWKTCDEAMPLAWESLTGPSGTETVILKRGCDHLEVHIPAAKQSSTAAEWMGWLFMIVLVSGFTVSAVTLLDPVLLISAVIAIALLLYGTYVDICSSARTVVTLNPDTFTVRRSLNKMPKTMDAAFSRDDDGHAADDWGSIFFGHIRGRTADLAKSEIQVWQMREFDDGETTHKRLVLWEGPFCHVLIDRITNIEASWIAKEINDIIRIIQKSSSIP